MARSNFHQLWDAAESTKDSSHMVLCGYGKILDIDLTTHRVQKKDIDPEFARKYVGGMGFGCKILYDEVGPDIDPLSLGNIIVFANGPLTGTQAPCSGRTEITTKSPLNGHIGTGNTGGMWGTLLKHAGFDVIIIRNQADKPVYLWIDDNKVEIRPAGHLWGKDIRETSDILSKELDPSGHAKISTLAIGPAGEHLVRYACPVNDYYHSASRSCAGAVMGAKKLKAIAVRGTGATRIARPDEFKEAARSARERLIMSLKDTKMRGDGAVLPDRRKEDIDRGCLPAKNFQTGVLPQFVETRGREIAQKYVSRIEGTCYSCPMSCFELVEVKEGKYAGVKANRGPAPGMTSQWGAKCAIDNLPAIWKCKELCDELGMDYGSASGVIAFAMELFQRGLISTADTDGLELGWGNEDAIIQLIQKIAFRDGFGDVLADGSVKAATRIGKGAEHYVMTVKGVELMGNDPRSGTKGWIFGYLTNPRGGDNVKSTHFSADIYNPNWWVDKFDMPEDVKKNIYSVPPQEISNAWTGKAMMCKWFEDLYSVLNALGLCFFQSGINIVLGPTNLARMFSACTGWETTPQDIMSLGERVFTLLKAYTIRQGLSRKDDTYPEKFFTEPLPEGPAKGAVVSRETVVRLLDEYYELRGWDRVTGIPTAQKLAELGLSEIADELSALGKLPKR